MNIVIDTNVLVRLIVDDDQSKKARKIFSEASSVTIPTHVFCEFVWVLSSRYSAQGSYIAKAIREFSQTEKVICNDAEVLAGLEMMDAGGDFADGVNAYAGMLMAPPHSIFVSFDKRAVRLLAGRGLSALVPE
ncbi:MAG: type II toxin-antitoxin system VapC family toxin [Burkholderiaceae bacterium]|jgi:predicted nucleic-acid-binding protein|nr:type II toxin-antitoxin system VapC family toxin [Burkholderiaceae bacterium]